MTAAQRTKAKESLPVPDAVWKRLPASREALSGRVEPYVFVMKCAKRGCELVEGHVWKGVKFRHDGTKKVAYVCDRCYRKGD